MPPLYESSAFCVFCQQNLATLYTKTANQINDMPIVLRSHHVCFITFEVFYVCFMAIF